MKKSLDSIEVLASNWMPSDIEYINFLKQKYPILYTRLLEVENFTKLNLYGLVIEGKAAFRYCYSNLRLCLSQSKQYFHCYDCSFANDAALCRKCFNLDFHKNHNWVCMQMPEKPYCDCGYTHKISSKVMCKSHNQLNKLTDPLTQQQKYIFKCFFTLYTKIMINILANSKNSLAHFDKYTEGLRQLAKFSLEYCQEIYQIFDSQFQQKSSQTVLQKFIGLNRFKNVLTDNFLFLTTHLCQYPPFEYILNQALYTQINFNCNEKVLKYFFKISDNFSVLNKLAQNKIIVYNKQKQNTSFSIIKFYCDILENYTNKNQHGLLLSVWKHIKNDTKIFNYFFGISNLAIDVNYSTKLFVVLNDCIEDFEFFKEMISLVVTQWKYRQFEGYFSHSRFYNQIALVTLKAVKGNIDKVSLAFQKCDKLFLSKFISFYFIQLFIDRKKCKFNNLTTKCFVQVIKKFNLDCINLVNLPSTIPLLKMGRILSIVLRNLTAYQYVEDLELLKIAKSVDNEQLINQKQQKIFEWFQQYFYMRTQLSQNLVIQFKKQGILQIQKVKKFLVKQSSFTNGTKTFTYNGQDVDVNPDLLLHDLNVGYQEYGLHDDEDKSMFTSQSRIQVVSILFEKAIEKVNFDKFSSYNKTDRYIICATAVILNKMTKGENPVFVKYVQKLKQLSIQIWRQNSAVDRLFRIKKYKPKIVQEIKKQSPKKQQNSVNEVQVEKQQVKVQKVNIKEETKTQELKVQQLKVQELKVQELKSQVVKVQQKQNKVEQDLVKTQQKQQKATKIKQKTKEQLLTEAKKKKKASRIAQKYSASSKKFLQMHKQHIKDHEKQVCLVCRQSLSDYGLLSFYVNLQKKTKGLISKMYNTNNRYYQFVMDSCFHAVHPKCCGNNNRKCILCTNPFDCFIPIVTEQLDEESQALISRMWWQEQFTQLIYKKFGKLSDFDIIMNMIQSYVMTISTMYLLPHKSAKTPLSKTQKWLSFLSHMIKIQNQNTKKQLQKQIESYLAQSTNSADFLNIIRIVVSLSVISKVYPDVPGDYQMLIKDTVLSLLEKIKGMFEFGYCEQIMRHVEVILGEKFCDDKFIEKPDIQVLWKQLKFMSGLPETILQLRKKYEGCAKCPAISSFLCLGCDKIICGVCTKLTVHVLSGCVCIDLGTGTLSYPDTINNRQQTVGLYFNCFREQYKPKDMDLDEYYIDMTVINKAMQKILS